MKKNLFLLFTILVVVLMFSCEKEEIMTVAEDQASLNFGKESYSSTYDDDSIKFLAIFNSSAEVARLGIPIRLSGKIMETDRTYKLQVNVNETKGIVQGTHYTMEAEQVFRGGKYEDTTLIVLNVKKIIEDKIEGRLFVELIPNENFVRGMDAFQYMVINVSGAGFTSTQPTFWRKNSLGDYGGDYLPIKAEKFVELNGIPEEKWVASNKAILFAYAKKTYQWFEDHPTYVDGERVIFKGTVEY